MASTVISGSSNPSYRNNTGENVRVVINYMAGTAFAPARFGFPSFPSSLNQPIQLTPPVPSSITINWAGLSVGSSSSFGNIAIGRNLAYSQIFRDLRVQGAPGPQPEPVPVSSFGIPNQISENTSLAASSNNAAGGGGEIDPLPTELILAPGQTFSAVCGVHNIVVIPENG